ncbi:MAG: DUF3108 domain-containing protein [Candidatus Omnitrophica bacterium]|nr:DUF3108 domain-containing protein [Candidatus Omnitrophota bacterium]
MKKIIPRLFPIFLVALVFSYIFYQFFGWQLAVRQYKKHIISELSEGAAQPIKTPEKLVYTLRYMGLPSGKAILKITEIGDYQGEKAYFLSANARTSDFISVFFEIEGWVKSILDKKKLRSLYFQEHSQATGHRQNDKVVVYNQDKHYLEVDGEQFRILPDTVDPLGSFYVIRLIKLEKLKQGQSLNIKSRKRDRTLYVKYEGTEILDSPFGKIETYKIYIHLKRVKATSKHEISGYMWVTADEKRIPVSIDINTKAGQVSVRLLDLDL